MREKSPMVRCSCSAGFPSFLTHTYSSICAGMILRADLRAPAKLITGSVLRNCWVVGELRFRGWKSQLMVPAEMSVSFIIFPVSTRYRQ